ncbi:MAG: HypC/HybG/HupF family hydrogenase formation chaperone [Planctomycetota bacterium]
MPGRIAAVVEAADPVARTGTVDFQGNRVEVSLALVPEAGTGSWVLVHAGMAIEHLDQNEARETWRWLEEAGLGNTPEELAAEPEPGA